MGGTKLPHPSKPKGQSWLTYFEFFPACHSLPKMMFTAVLSKSNLLSPKAGDSSRKRKLWCYLIPHKSSSDHYQGHTSPHSPLTEAIWMVHKKKQDQNKHNTTSKSWATFSSDWKIFTKCSLQAKYQHSLANLSEPLWTVVQRPSPEQGDRAPEKGHRGSLPLGWTELQLHVSHCHTKSKAPLSSWWIASGFCKRQWPQHPCAFSIMLGGFPLGT